MSEYEGASFNHYWDRVRERAELQDVRIHDIRHYSRIRLIPDWFMRRFRELSAVQSVAQDRIG